MHLTIFNSFINAWQLVPSTRTCWLKIQNTEPQTKTQRTLLWNAKYVFKSVKCLSSRNKMPAHTQANNQKD